MNTNMKKNILGLLLFCCMGLFVSCSDDESADAKQMRVSAIFPESITTGQSEIAGHKLRCILELWTKGEGAKLAYRSEVAVEPTDEINKLPVELTIDNGTYDCLMWVDYIDAASVAVTRAEDGFLHYEDKYYSTSDLRNITVKDMSSLIDNNACDAFYYSGEVQKREGEAFVLEPELIRPFAKVSVLEKNLREFNLLRALSVSYNAPIAFDISTGKTSGEPVMVSHSVAAFNPELTPDGTLFSAYIFANEENAYMDEIHLTFTNKHGTVQDVTVPSGLVPLSRSQHIKVSGNMMNESPIEDTEFDIVFDINVSDWELSSDLTITTQPLVVKVGDFIYKDGTFGKEYSEDAIGIVFALKESTDDSDYGTAFAGKEIAGYAMALESTDRIYIGGEKGAEFTDGTDITKLNTTEAYNADYTTLSYSGFEYSKAFDAIFGATTESKLFNQYNDLKEKYAHSAANFSSWYIPSAHQMYDICARTYGIDGSESAKNEALRDAYDIAVERIGTNARLNGNATRSAWPLTSSFDRESGRPTQPPITLLLDTNVAPIKSKTRGNWAADSQYFLRPVLTIFK